MSRFCQQRLQFGCYIAAPVSTHVLRFSFTSLSFISLAVIMLSTGGPGGEENYVAELGYEIEYLGTATPEYARSVFFFPKFWPLSLPSFTNEPIYITLNLCRI